MRKALYFIVFLALFTGDTLAGECRKPLEGRKKCTIKRMLLVHVGKARCTVSPSPPGYLPKYIDPYKCAEPTNYKGQWWCHLAFDGGSVGRFQVGTTIVNAATHKRTVKLTHLVCRN
jgi:hypothetical protein